MIILFVYLKSFKGIGGIENYTKTFINALQESERLSDAQIRVISLHDDKPDLRYTGKAEFKSHNGNRTSFIIDVIKSSTRADVIIFGHINLSSIGLLVKLLNRNVKMAIIIFGLEAWRYDGVISNLFFKLCYRIISISEYTKNKFIEIHKCNPDKFELLPPCLDPYTSEHNHTILSDSEIISRYGVDNKSPVLISVCRLYSSEKYKGYDNVIRSIVKLRNKYNDIKYLIVGRYDEKEYSRIMRLIEEHDLAKHITLTGYVTQKELTQLYRLSDIFVMPSRGEGFGIVFIEALSYGLPVIAGNRDASVETLKGGKLGMLVDPDSVNEISDAIETMLVSGDGMEILNPDYLRKEVYNYYSYSSFSNNFNRIAGKF